MKRLFALSLLALVVWACESSPTEVQVQKPNFLGTCAGISSGAISQVVTSPSYDYPINPHKLHVWNYAPTYPGQDHKDTVYAQVFRDDPNFPGVQNYCQDYAAVVTWTGQSNNGSTFGAENIQPQQITVVATGLTSLKRLIGTAGGKADTTWVYSQY